LSEKFWFDVARMSHAHTGRFLDENQQALALKNKFLA
jgi:hypothetical protein